MHQPSLLINSARRGVNLLKKGHFKTFWQQVFFRLYNNSTTIGFCRDLEKEFEASIPKIDIGIRLIEEGDLDYLLEYGEVEQIDPRLVAAKQALIEADIPKCYVAVTKNDKPCFIQWVFAAPENRRLQKFFKGIFPQLNSNEVLLEEAYMHRSFRGLGIMQAAIDRILKIEKASSIKRAITFVDIENIPSLKGIRRSGFYPCMIRKDHWILFQRRISYHPLTQDILNKYENLTADFPDHLFVPA